MHLLSVVKSIYKNHQKKLFLGLGIISFASGIYLVVLLRSPSVFDEAQAFTPQQLQSIKVDQNRVIIPKIGVNITYLSGNDDVLEKGAWWRYPERGNPVKGGNFILSAHRFSLGLTPGQTRTKSPFYHIEKLQVGDEIVVDYEGKRYEYGITEKFNVTPDQVSIESASEEAKLTLYSCTLKGSADGRVVLIAKLKS